MSANTLLRADDVYSNAFKTHRLHIEYAKVIGPYQPKINPLIFKVVCPIFILIGLSFGALSFFTPIIFTVRTISTVISLVCLALPFYLFHKNKWLNQKLSTSFKENPPFPIINRIFNECNSVFLGSFTSKDTNHWLKKDAVSLDVEEFFSKHTAAVLSILDEENKKFLIYKQIFGSQTFNHLKKVEANSEQFKLNSKSFFENFYKQALSILDVPQDLYLQFKQSFPNYLSQLSQEQKEKFKQIFLRLLVDSCNSWVTFPSNYQQELKALDLSLEEVVKLRALPDKSKFDFYDGDWNILSQFKYERFKRQFEESYFKELVKTDLKEKIKTFFVRQHKETLRNLPEEEFQLFGLNKESFLATLS